VNSQGNLFDPPPRLPTVAEATERRDTGMQSVSDHADLAWKAAAGDIVASFPPGTEFLSEELRERLELAGFRVHDKRVMGPLMISFAKAGMVRKAYLAPARSSNLSPKWMWVRLDRAAKGA
jgi:hypothetical protein